MRYSFTFQERFDGYSDELSILDGEAPAGRMAEPVQTASHTVAAGETLWAIAQRYNLPLERLLEANPGIKNPNLIHVGEAVAIP